MKNSTQNQELGAISKLDSLLSELRSMSGDDFLKELDALGIPYVDKKGSRSFSPLRFYDEGFQLDSKAVSLSKGESVSLLNLDFEEITGEENDFALSA